MELVMFGAVLSVFCLALAGFLMYRGHVTFGTLSAFAALILTGTLALRNINNSDMRLLILLPVVAAMVTLIWWIKSKQLIAMWSYVAMLFIHASFMKFVFMPY